MSKKQQNSTKCIVVFQVIWSANFLPVNHIVVFNNVLKWNFPKRELKQISFVVLDKFMVLEWTSNENKGRLAVETSVKNLFRRH